METTVSLVLVLLLFGVCTLAKPINRFSLIPEIFRSDGDGGMEPQKEESFFYDVEGKGQWRMFQENGGVSAMHLVINHLNKAIYFDASIYIPAKMQLTPGTPCVPIPGARKGEVDCWAHAAEMDVFTGDVRPLKTTTDTWCSSGGFGPDGTLVSTGGWKYGGRSVRYIGACENCDFQEFPTALTGERWYSTQQILPDGSFIVIGGRGMFNYEYVPQPGASNTKNIPLPFLKETSDKSENNLYPFAHLSPDGNVFLFANNRAVLLDPKSGSILRNFPVLPGGARNYPSSGMSALLPLDLTNPDPTAPVQAEVIVCGGSVLDAFDLAPKKVFPRALKSCGRISITDPEPSWLMENMPMERTLGDMLLLPNTDVLIINGARRGCAGWDFARDPVLVPLLYRNGTFTQLKPTGIARMYHSTSAVLPDATVLVAGSNANQKYEFKDVLFPTEVRVEKFYPPYLEVGVVEARPMVVEYTVPNVVWYGQVFRMEFGILNFGLVDERDVMVTLYYPPFTTHGFSQGQRLLVLRVEDLSTVLGMRVHVTVSVPGSAAVAPPGYYMLFVVYKGIPSTAVWVKVQPEMQ